MRLWTERLLMRRELTDRQKQLLNFIVDYRDAHGYAPSIREMMEAMAIRSTNGIRVHLACLEKKGCIRREFMKSRAIDILMYPSEIPA